MTGHKGLQPIAIFGEKVMFRFTPDKTNRRKMETDWSHGYFLGINPETTEYLIGTNDNIYSCCTMRRLEEDRAFDASLVKDITIKYSDYVMQGAKSSPAEIRPAEVGQPVPAPGGDPVPRRAKLNPAGSPLDAQDASRYS